MTKTGKRLAVFGAALAVVLVVLGAFFIASPRHKQPAAPKHQAFTLEPNFASLEGAQEVTMFDRVTVPIPTMWIGEMSDPDSVMNYSLTACDDTAACPHIEFINLDSNEGKEYSVKQWAALPCSSGRQHAVEGPVDVDLGGQSAKLYRQSCGRDKYASPRYAWEIPDKQLLVLITDSGSSPEITEGVLEKAQWQ